MYIGRGDTSSRETIIMKRKILAYWDKLLNLYFNDSSLSEEWRKRVMRLLAQDLFEEEKSAALEKYFDKIVDIKRGDSVQVELLIGSDARVPERAFELLTPTIQKDDVPQV